MGWLAWGISGVSGFLYGNSNQGSSSSNIRLPHHRGPHTDFAGNLARTSSNGGGSRAGGGVPANSMQLSTKELQELVNLLDHGQQQFSSERHEPKLAPASSFSPTATAWTGDHSGHSRSPHMHRLAKTLSQRSMSATSLAAGSNTTLNRNMSSGELMHSTAHDGGTGHPADGGASAPAAPGAAHGLSAQLQIKVCKDGVSILRKESTLKEDVKMHMLIIHLIGARLRCNWFKQMSVNPTSRTRLVYCMLHPDNTITHEQCSTHLTST